MSERTHVPRRPCFARFTKALTRYRIHNYGNYYWKPNLPFFSESAELLNFFSILFTQLLIYIFFVYLCNLLVFWSIIPPIGEKYGYINVLGLVWPCWIMCGVAFLNHEVAYISYADFSMARWNLGLGNSIVPACVALTNTNYDLDPKFNSSISTNSNEMSEPWSNYYTLTCKYYLFGLEHRQLACLNCQLDFLEMLLCLILSRKSPKVTFFTKVFPKLEKLCCAV